MPRVIIAECKQEVSTFNPVPSRYEDFQVVRGADLLAFHRSVGQEIGGALTVFDEGKSFELVPTFGAKANTSGGVLSAEGFKSLSRGFLETLLDAGSVDGTYFSLHGAMQAENENDPEGYLLQEARRILGEKIPIVPRLARHPDRPHAGE
jgi:microcystin degradation protein MlrC